MNKQQKDDWHNLALGFAGAIGMVVLVLVMFFGAVQLMRMV